METIIEAEIGSTEGALCGVELKLGKPIKAGYTIGADVAALVQN